MASSTVRTVRSDDGAVAYRLALTASGLLVERVQCQPGRSRVVLTTVFFDDEGFERWCDADSVRFEYPLLYDHLKRHGRALFVRPA